MPNQFVKGRTNNHLTWVMVDATDFATPESALSAATKIKIYGKRRGATGVAFVSSGTGSLTNDIQHVGASVLGIYTIALAKADLSDASAAWYDQYVISLSATGAAYQALVVDGGIDLSAMSAYQSLLSDLQSAVTIAQSMASDAASAAQQGNSRLLVNQSVASDILSRCVLIASMASDAASAAQQVNSRVLLVQSTLSDIDSAATSQYSDLASKVGAITATLSASDISDIASAVKATLASDLSDILSAAVQTNSRVLLNQSRISDLASYLVVMSGLLSDTHSAAILGASHASDAHSAATAAASRAVLHQSALSDVQSYLVALSGLLSDVQSAADSQYSDLASKIGNVSVTLTASDISDIASAVAAGGVTVSFDASDLSDIASAVWAHAVGARVDSRVLVIQSAASDTLSRAVVIASMASDAASAAQQVNSRVLVLASSVSDLASALALVQSLASDAASAAQQGSSRALLTVSRVSDVQSYLLALSGALSDADSALSSQYSDLVSKVGAIATSISASDMSDIASRVGVLLASDLSDLLSRTTQINSRALVTQSQASDIYNLLAGVSATLSDVESQIDAGVPIGASALSDLRSAIAAHGLQATGDEPASVIQFADTYADKIDFLTALARNKITQTSAVQTLRNDADTDTIASAAVSDDGTTFERGEFS